MTDQEKKEEEESNKEKGKDKEQAGENEGEIFLEKYIRIYHLLFLKIKNRMRKRRLKMQNCAYFVEELEDI
jgi:hypothetical protein